MTVSINKVAYDKVQDAVLAAENGQVIKFDSNMTEDVEIYGGKKLSFDLNGFKLDNGAGPTVRVMKHSVLNVIDTKGTAGIIDSKIAGQPAVQVDPGAIFTMNTGKLTRSAEAPDNMGYILNNLGVVTLGGKINVTSTSTSLAAIKTGFDLDVPAEAVYLSGETSDYMAALTINGGTIEGVPGAIVNDQYSKLTIISGTINAQNSVIYNLGVCDIRGGELTSTGKSVTESGTLDNVYEGSITVSGGTLTSEGSQPIFAVIVHDNVKTPSNPVVTGGTFSRSFDAQYLAPGYAFGGAGGLQVISLSWKVHDAGVSGVGFTGHRKLIISRDKFKYTDKGIAVPIEMQGAILIAVNVKGGAVGYFDKTKGIVTLYRGGTEISNPTELEDLTLVFLEL